MFLILTKSIRKFKINYIDLRNAEFPCLFDVELENYKKQAGIIWKHREDEDVELDVIAKRTHESSFEKMTVIPDYPPFVPPLIELLSPD